MRWLNCLSLKQVGLANPPSFMLNSICFFASGASEPFLRKRKDAVLAARGRCYCMLSLSMLGEYSPAPSSCLSAATNRIVIAEEIISFPFRSVGMEEANRHEFQSAQLSLSIISTVYPIYYYIDIYVSMVHDVVKFML